MDTHVASHPDIEPATAGVSARLPGEADGMPPITGEPQAGERLPSSAPKPARRRRGPLLAGVALAALVIGAGAALLGLHNGTIGPMPHWLASISGTGSNGPRTAQGSQRPILAPSAALAKVPLPPAPPATRDAYTPRPRDQEVAEVLSFHPGAADPAHAGHAGDSGLEGHPAMGNAGRPVVAPASADPNAAAGSIPREPGSELAPLPSPAPLPASPVSASAAPTGAAPKDATAAVIASLPQARPAAPGPQAGAQSVPTPAPVAPPQAAEPRPAEMAAPVVQPPRPDAAALALNLRPAPMTSPEQVQVLNLVTEMATMVKDMRKQQAQLRADLAKSPLDVTARLMDFERRLALAEAKSGVAAADDAMGDGTAKPLVDPASNPAPVAPKIMPVAASQAVAVVPAPASVAPAKLYRVQAASPGLALLTQVDRGGGDGAQVQVVVGDGLPGYGRVQAIAQKGTAWVVSTEHGDIR